MERNNKHKRFAVVLGARPNFVKAAPFFKEAKHHPAYEFTLIHTGQHFDDLMSKIFFDEMSIPRPDIQLDIHGGFHTEKIGKMFSALRDIFQKSDLTALSFLAISIQRLLVLSRRQKQQNLSTSNQVCAVMIDVCRKKSTG